MIDIDAPPLHGLGSHVAWCLRSEWRDPTLQAKALDCLRRVGQCSWLLDVVDWVEEIRDEFLERESEDFRVSIRSVEDLAMQLGELAILEHAARPKAGKGDARPMTGARICLHALRRFATTADAVIDSLQEDLNALVNLTSTFREVAPGVSLMGPAHGIWLLSRSLVEALAGEAKALDWIASTEGGASSPQIGRKAPESASDLKPDDVAIVLAVAGGVDRKAAAVGAACVRTLRRQLSESHVRKRKTDLVQWGLLEPGPHFHLSAKGSAWATDLRTRLRNPLP